MCIRDRIVADDAKDADSYYVRMAIREVYAPFGYQMDTRAYYMIVKFGNTSNGGMCNNNAYYVTDSTDDVPLADESRAIIASWDSASLTAEQQESITEFQNVVDNPYPWEYIDE